MKTNRRSLIQAGVAAGLAAVMPTAVKASSIETVTNAIAAPGSITPATMRELSARAEQYRQQQINHLPCVQELQQEAARRLPAVYAGIQQSAVRGNSSYYYGVDTDIKLLDGTVSNAGSVSGEAIALIIADLLRADGFGAKVVGTYRSDCIKISW